MRFTINERRDIHFVRADETIDGNLDAWRNFIGTHLDSVRELNALSPDAKTKETGILKSRTGALLSGANANAIVDDGIMKNTVDPYRGYIEGQSAKWLKTACDETLASNTPGYRDDLNQLLTNSRQTAKLGTYFFTIGNFRLNTVRTNKNTATINFQTDLDAQVVLISDGTTVNVDSDTVGLRGLFDTIRNRFLDDMLNRLRDDIEPAYTTQSTQYRDSVQTSFFGEMTTLIGTSA